MRKRLQDKYKADKVYIFLGYVKGKEALYSQLSEHGYILIFKETLEIDGKVKGNCDAELVIKCVSDYFESNSTKVVLVTGDGDFACLVDFLKEKECSTVLLAPNKQFCSYLLKKRNVVTVFLEEQKRKFLANPTQKALYDKEVTKTKLTKSNLPKHSKLKSKIIRSRQKSKTIIEIKKNPQ